MGTENIAHEIQNLGLQGTCRKWATDRTRVRRIVVVGLEPGVAFELFN